MVQSTASRPCWYEGTVGKGLGSPAERQGTRLVKAEDVQKLCLTILGDEERYEPVSLEEDRPQMCMRRYIKLAQRIATALEEPRLFKELAACSRGTYTYDLKMLVKTHKREGSVSCRGVHSAVASSYKPLAHWVLSRIRQRSRHLPYVALNSKEIVKEVRGRRFHRHVILVTLDICDFYMSGFHEYMIRSVVRCGSTDAEREILKEALEFLNNHQFVTHESIPGAKFKVKKGSGMNLIHSGDVADLVLADCVEFYHLPNADAILSYIRFRDDILVIADGVCKFYDWFLPFKNTAERHGFIIKIEKNFIDRRRHVRLYRVQR